MNFLRKISLVFLSIGVGIMFCETVYVRIKYNKGFYNVTDIISDLSCVYLAFLLIIFGQTVSIGLLTSKELPLCLTRKVYRAVQFELLVGCIPIVVYIFRKYFDVGLYFVYQNDPFFQQIVIIVDFLNAITLIIASIISLSIITRTSKTNKS